MNGPHVTRAPGRLVLPAATAAGLMTPNPVSIGQDASVKEAASFLTDRGFSACPVIDEAGWPVGVLSRADIVAHHRQQARCVPAIPEYDEETGLTTHSGESLPSGFQVEGVDQTRVRDLMTPTILSVPSEAPARRVVGRMLDLEVHRVFVVDESGILIGVISALDVLRHLR